LLDTASTVVQIERVGAPFLGTEVNGFVFTFAKKLSIANLCAAKEIGLVVTFVKKTWKYLRTLATWIAGQSGNGKGSIRIHVRHIWCLGMPVAQVIRILTNAQTVDPEISEAETPDYLYCVFQQRIEHAWRYSLSKYVNIVT
jgi:hypothetical protein